MPAVSTAQTHTISRAAEPRACQIAKCKAPTPWRAVYRYSDGRGVHIPRCPLHLAGFALLHGIEVPSTALAEEAE
jgi:hypothetical protein